MYWYFIKLPEGLGVTLDFSVWGPWRLLPNYIPSTALSYRLVFYNTSLPPLLFFNKMTIIRVVRLTLYTNRKVQMANLQAPGSALVVLFPPQWASPWSHQH